MSDEKDWAEETTDAIERWLEIRLGIAIQDEGDDCRGELVKILREAAPVEPPEGSWGWALAQVKAGKRVTRPTKIDGLGLGVDRHGFIDNLAEADDNLPESVSRLVFAP